MALRSGSWGVERKILEHVGGEIARQDAEGDDLLLYREAFDEAGRGRRRPVLEHRLECRKVPRLDDAGKVQRGLGGHEHSSRSRRSVETSV